MTLIRICWVATLLLGGILLDFANAQDEPLTVAEKSDYKSTSLSSEVIEFVDWCDEKADHVTKHVFGQTVEGKDMVAAVIANPPYELGAKDDRVRTLVIGNIHSGECAPKEALLMMLRELTHNPDHPWLKNSVLVIAPNYNADGNDRIGKGNRPGQVGPVNGMGMRENSQQLDLNRDFMKLESPEARSLVGLIDKVNPHMFIDGHTTNGSKHQYALTYDIPHNPAAPQQVRDFLWSKMMPAVTKKLEEDAGIFTFYYGNFNRDMTAWTTYGFEPRYSTEYVGMRGRLSILSEAYSYLSYKDRILASKDFITACIQYASDNAETIKTLLDEVDNEFVETASKQPERIQVSMSAKVGKYDEKFLAKGYKDDQPHDYEVDFVAKYTSTRSIQLPYGYIIPNRHTRIVDRLLMHGIEVSKITESKGDGEIAYDVIKAINQPRRAFQKHRMVTLETERQTEAAEMTQGDYFVSTAQPLGRLAAYLLEPSSDDGFTFWNFLDDDLEVGQRYPIVSLIKTGEAFPLKSVDEVGGGVEIDFAMIDGPSSLLANQPAKPKWHQGTNQYLMTRWGRELLVNAETGAVDGPVVGSRRPNGLAESIRTALGENTDDETVNAIAGNQIVVSKSGDYQIYSGQSKQVLYNTQIDRAIWLKGSDPETELFEFSKDDDFLMFVVDKKMQFLNLETEKVSPSSNSDIAGRSSGDHFGKLDWVYQEELYGRGNFKGFWYSEASDRIAILDLDEREVQNYTVLDHIPTRGLSEVTAYPKAGDPIPKVTLQFENLNHHQMSGGSDGTLAYGELISNVNWSPDGNRLFVQVQNREQTTLDLIALDFDSPSVEANAIKKTTLIQEKTDGWIESYGTPEMFDDGSFLWLSARSGFTHLYHYEKDGTLRKQLTSGDWEIRSLIGVEPNGTYAFFTATKDDPLNEHGFRLEIATGDLQQITDGDGTHSLDFCDDYSYFIDTVSTFSTPERSFICRADGKRLREMETSADDRLKYLNVSEPEFLQIKAADGHPLDAVIIRPPNFDPSKKYPVLYHVYSGPQSPRVRNRFQGKFYLWHQMLAQKGYVVWMCDNRSSSFRGKQGMWETHRDLGKNELADITSSVDWLKKQSWVDSDRLGIWGWSYGGYMTAYAMTHSRQFKMGISGAPVTDWRNYDAIYTERLMGLPQDNPDGYESSSVLNVAGDLHGKLLLIHGTMDDNVHISNSMQFIYELQKANKDFDLMVYPKNRHSVRAEDQIGHLRRLMTKFVLENL
jgi:dienelactone hydrolase